MLEMTVGYYIPRSSLGITLTQTGTCTDENKPIIVTDVTFAPSLSRDGSNYCPWFGPANTSNGLTTLTN